MLTEEGHPCSHCGYIALKRVRRSAALLSDDKRRQARVETYVDFTFSIGGVMKKAKMIDYSEGGVRIVYHGEPVPVNSVLDLNINKPDTQGATRAVWTKKLSITMNSTGLKFKNRGRVI